MQEPDPAETTRFPALAHRDFRVLWLGMLLQSVTIAFQYYAQMWLIYELTDSALVLGILDLVRGVAMLAFGLNLALNVGVSRRGKIDVDIDAGMSESLSRFFDREGASWGARRDVIRRAAPAVIEWCEELREIGGVTKASVAVEFDEFRLVVLVRGQGRSGTGSAVRSGDASVTLDHVARTIASRYECKAKLVNGGSASFDFQH